MPKFVIEREIPGAGKLTAAELKTISRKSCGVLSGSFGSQRAMGPQLRHWRQGLLHLPRHGRIAGPAPRGTGRLSRRQDFPGVRHHRSFHRRVMHPPY